MSAVFASFAPSKDFVRAPQAMIGAGGGGKDTGGQSRVAVEDPDTLQSIAYAKLLDVIGEGQIGGLVNGLKSIFLGGVPLENDDGTMNFSGVTVDVRNGTQNQEYIPGFASVQTTDTLGTQVRHDIPIVHQIDNPDANAAYITLAVDALALQDPKNGDVHGSSVTMRIEYQAQNAGFVNWGDVTITGKTRSRYQRGIRVDLGGVGPWTLRISRLTVDSDSATLSNNTFVDFITSIVDHKFNYPNTALIGIQIDARQFSSIPERSYLVDGIQIRVPNNYNPVSRTYSGVWNGGFIIAQSDNPAWCLYDILTSTRYGLGNYLDVNQIDKASLYQIGQYCDEFIDDGFGGTEPRFTMNCVLQARADAFKVVQDLCSVFRGMTYWGAGTLVAVQDAPRAAVKKFAYANVVNGMFQYVGSQRKDRHTVCQVTWNDPNDGYKQAIEYVELEEALNLYGYRPTDMVAFGCTSRGQAHRAGLWLLWSEFLDTDALTFQTGMEGSTLLPGEIIMVADPLRAGARMGGRVKSATVNSAVLDASVPFVTGHSYFFYYVDSTGTDRSVGVINPGTSTTDTIHFVSSVPAGQIPQPADVWVLSGVGVIEPQTFRVLGVKESAANIYDVSAITHTPTKFPAIDSGTLLELPPIGMGGGLIALIPSNLAIFDTTYVMAPGLLGSKLVLSWSGNTSSYILQWRAASGGWNSITLGSPTYELLGVTEGISYDFRLYGVAADGQKSAALESTYTVLGKSAPPGPCTALAAVGAYREIDLTWANPEDLDLDHVEILEAIDNDPTHATVVGTSVTQAFARVGLNTGGKITRYYWVRAVDTSGNVGPLNSNLGTVATTILVSTSDFDELIQTDQLAQDVVSDIAGLVEGTVIGQIPDLVASEIADKLVGLTADSTTVTADDTTHFAGTQSFMSTVLEGDLALQQQLDISAARIDENSAAIQTEQTARADADTAMATQITTVAAQTGVVQATLQDEITARTDADTALATRVTTVEAGVGPGVVAAIAEEATARATADEVNATATQTVSASLGTTNAAVQTQSTALVNLQGAAQATYTIKAQIAVDGKVYAAGMGLGVYDSPGGVQTSVYFLADRFSLLNLSNGVLTTPFIIDAGTTYIRTAMIQDATITTAKIQDAAINNAKIANAAITAAQIQNAQIVNAHIVNAQVDRLKIAGTSVTTSAAFDFGYWGGQQWDGNWRDRGFGSISVPENAHLLVVIQNSFDDGASLDLSPGLYAPNKRNFDFRVLLNGGLYGTAELQRTATANWAFDSGDGGSGATISSWTISPQTDWSFCWACFNVSGNISVDIQYRLRNETTAARTFSSATRIFLFTAYR